MRELEVKTRNNDVVVFDQLYANINDNDDIHINGSISTKERENSYRGKIRIYANLCNSDGKILYIFEAYRNFDISMDDYCSFSMYASSLSRFVEMDKTAYVELYISKGETLGIKDVLDIDY